MTLTYRWYERYQKLTEIDTGKHYDEWGYEDHYRGTGESKEITSFEQLEGLVQHYEELKESVDECEYRAEGGGNYLTIYLHLGEVKYDITRTIIDWVKQR